MMTESNLLDQRTRALQAMVQVSQLIDSLDLDHVLGMTLKIITDTIDADKGSIFLVDENLRPRQRFLTQRALPPEMTRKVAHDVLEKGLAGWAVRQRAGVMVPDVRADDRWYVFEDNSLDDVRAALCVPLMHEDHILGVITLVSEQVGHFSSEDVQVVSAIASQAGLAIRNTQLIDHLQTQQRELNLMLETVRDALLTLDSQFRVRLINRQAREILGVPPEQDIAGQPLEQLAGASVYAQVMTRLAEMEGDQSAVNIIVRDDPSQTDYAMNITSLQHTGYVIMLHDVTTIRDVNRLKTQMLQMLSHNLRNPMNIVWGYVDLLRMDSQSDKPADDRFVSGILRALQRMEIILEETLSASRHITEDYANLQRDLFKPNAALDTLLQEIRDLSKQKQLTLAQDIQPEMRPFLAWSFQLQEAMSNLVGNAVKYTPEGGTITLKARQEAERFYFSVTDTGIGIPLALQDKLFTEYYRAKRPALGSIPGTGLGLSLVKKIIQAHGGEVWFTSEEGQGSTFGLWVPVIPAE